VIRLSFDPAPSFTGEYRADPHIPQFPAAFRFIEPSWSPTGADSVQVRWTNGYVLVSMHLSIGATEVTGWMRGSSDVMVPVKQLPVTPVFGRRTDCPRSLSGVPPA
jgi:hypothetical protein